GEVSLRATTRIPQRQSQRTNHPWAYPRPPTPSAARLAVMASGEAVFAASSEIVHPLAARPRARERFAASVAVVDKRLALITVAPAGLSSHHHGVAIVVG